MNSSDKTSTWADLGIALYEKLTERNAFISYDFEDFKIEVPANTGDQEETATWKLNGSLKIRTTDPE